MSSLAHDIASALSGGKPEKNGDGYSCLCPVHGDKHNSLSIKDDGNGSVIVHCHVGCNYKDIKDKLVSMGFLDEWKPEYGGSSSSPKVDVKQSANPKEPIPEKEKVSVPWKLATRDSKAIEHVQKYFSSRGVNFETTPRCFKSGSYKDKKSGEYIHQIVSAVTTLDDDNVYASCRTRFDPETWQCIPHPDGRKKPQLGKCASKGRGVWFNRKGDMHILIVGEGQETVLSAMQVTGHNGVAGLTANGMEALKLPDQTDTIYICVDSDTSFTGQRASIALAKRFEDSAPGKKAFLVTPCDDCFSSEPTKLDFNDLLMDDPTGDKIRERFSNATPFHKIEWRPPENSSEGQSNKAEPVDAATLLGGFQVTKEYTDKLGNEEFLVKDLILSNHVATIIAMSGGGKTAFFFRYVAPKLAQEGLKVWYCDNDSPTSEHGKMRESAEQHGFMFLNPDAVLGQSAETLLATLVQIAESGADLGGYVFIMDTLKKFCDMMGKNDIKEFFKLARKLTALGATVILLGHANKYRDKDGNLIFEGTGDVKADSDELIYFESVQNPSGGIDVTSICDPSRGAKVRGIFKPFSFHITPEREIQFYDSPLPVVDLSATTAPKATDDEILTVATQYLEDREEPVTQAELIDYACDAVEGTAGKERVRKLIVKRSMLKDKFTTQEEMPLGTRFVFTAGPRNKRLFELPPEPPKQQPVFGEENQ